MFNSRELIRYCLFCLILSCDYYKASVCVGPEEKIYKLRNILASEGIEANLRQSSGKLELSVDKSLESRAKKIVSIAEPYFYEHQNDK